MGVRTKVFHNPLTLQEKACRRALSGAFRRGWIASDQQQTRRTLLDRLRVEYGIAKPSSRLFALTDLDSGTWVGAGFAGCWSSPGLNLSVSAAVTSWLWEGSRFAAECRRVREPERSREAASPGSRPDASVWLHATRL